MIVLDEEIIKNIKSLGIDMIRKAGSGHPGIVLGAAPILYTLYSRHLHINANDPNWMNRDRFILSAGHGSALLYATLFMAGLDYSISDLQAFRQLHARVPGHPEIEVSPYIEATTGPLGQGVATAVGIALAQKIMESYFLLEDRETLFDYYTYVLCGDGDLMEGVSYEASSFASVNGLDHLIVLYDSNRTTLDAKTDFVFEENIKQRFEAMGWHTEEVQDGSNVEEIDKAIIKAKKEKKPSLIEIHTVLGKDSLLEDTNLVHGAPLKEEDYVQLKEKWNWRKEPFYFDPVLKENFKNKINARSSLKYKEFEEKKKKCPKKEELYFLETEQSISIDCHKIPLDNKGKPTRISNGILMNATQDQIPFWIGGSADLSSSTNAYLKDGGKLTRENYLGKNIAFGVREHAMGAILNGLSLNHFKCFGSTFLAFSDYMKPAIRLSALMKRPICYIFTHDSILIGEDGPTHQPIEHLTMLRSIPNLYTFRPCDEREIRGCLKVIVASTETPSALVLARTGGTLLPTSNEDYVSKGAYIIRKERGKRDATLIATGTEVEVAYHIAETLWEENKIDLRVVSMPSMELFRKQSSVYQEEILPRNTENIVLEAGASLSWGIFVSSPEYLITIDQFGYSGKAEDVKKVVRFQEKDIKERIERLVRK